MGIIKTINSIKEKRLLEDKVIRFMTKVKSLQETNPKLAFRYLTQATRLYHEKLRYKKIIDEKFNDIFLSFVSKYTPEFSF